MCDKIRIVFVGLYKESNLGDPVIQDCTEWLYESYYGQEVSKTRLFLNYCHKTRKSRRLVRWKNRLNRWSGNVFYKFDDCLFNETKKYFKKKLIGNDLAVAVGGGVIKFKYQYFHLYISAFLEAAQELSIPVVFNAIGVEGYDKDDKRCQMLKESLHLPCVKYITTRDDIGTLQKGYFDMAPNLPLAKVADPAVWASEIYNIKKKSDSNIIGIGIARGGLFADNGIDISADNMLKTYSDLIESLITSGYDVRIFTNGATPDNEFACKVSNALIARGFVVGCIFPSTPEELIRLLASCKAVIATRLHSCIISYSLDVPAIGLVWNDKLRLFGENINSPEYYIQPKDMNKENIVAKFEKAIICGYNQEHRNHFRSTIVESISGIDQYIR